MTTPDTDVRPPLSEVEQIAQLKRDLDDLRSTMMARVSRQPTGDIEPTIRTTPKPGTLFLDGATVNRADYPVLWQWVTEQGLVGAGKPFGAGNGSTTFGLPDYRGRAFVGATAARPVGTLYGASERVITPQNMAAHTHQVSVDTHGNHGHGADVGSDDPSHQHHNNHRHDTPDGVSYNPGSGSVPSLPIGIFTGNAVGAHGHFVTVFGASAGGHTVRQVVVGDNVPLNLETPAFTGNWLIWI